jgi:hypothetical protein
MSCMLPLCVACCVVCAGCCSAPCCSQGAQEGQPGEERAGPEGEAQVPALLMRFREVGGAIALPVQLPLSASNQGARWLGVGVNGDA